MEGTYGENKEIYIQDKVVVDNNTLRSNNADPGNDLGTLSLVDYDTDCEKCIEWHQSDISIGSVYQEWAVVEESKSLNNTLNGQIKTSKTATIQIPLKKVTIIKIFKQSLFINLNPGEKSSTIKFMFTHGSTKAFLSAVSQFCNIPVSKNDPNVLIMNQQKEVKALETSLTELKLFPDEKTRVIWAFLEYLYDKPSEATMTKFSQVTAQFSNIFYNADTVSNNSRMSSKTRTAEDYELISENTLLPPRVLGNRRDPLSSEQWLTYFNEDGQIIKSDLVKEIIFYGGISPEGQLRCEVWKFLLGYYPWNSTFAEREAIKEEKKKEYNSMKFQWKSFTSTQEDNFTAYKERKSLIEKDVCRTDRNLEYFSGDSNPNLQILQDILMTYVMYNFDLGYVQGMSDLLSPLLMLLNDEVDAFWCFAGLMKKVGPNFALDQTCMMEQLHQLYDILSVINPELNNHLDSHESGSMSFCFRWLLIWFKREFKIQDIYTLWEVLLTESLCKNFHILMCAAILDSEKEKIIRNDFGLTEILQHVNQLAYEIDLEQSLRKAEAIYRQIKTTKNIPAVVRDILGLAALPEDSANQNENSREQSSETEEYSSVESSNTFFLSKESDSSKNSFKEFAFENSINFSYL